MFLILYVATGKISAAGQAAIHVQNGHAGATAKKYYIKCNRNEGVEESKRTFDLLLKAGNIVGESYENRLLLMVQLLQQRRLAGNGRGAAQRARVALAAERLGPDASLGDIRAEAEGLIAVEKRERKRRAAT